MLLLFIIKLLVSNALTLRQDKSILYSRTTIFILFYSSILLYYITNTVSITKSISLFNGLLFCKNNTLTFTFFIFIITILILILTSFYSKKEWTIETASFYTTIIKKNIKYKNTEYINKTGEQFKIIEYPLIILFILIGGVFLMSSSDLISIFLSIELQSYGLYLLCSIYRNSELATYAGLTYFLLGGLSSCIILLGQSLLYVNSGNTSLDSIYIMNNIFTNNLINADITNNILPTMNVSSDQFYIQLSLLILSTGFLFKISAAPFHFWSPDVYDAIPTIVTTFVAIIAKITIFIFFYELVYYTSFSSYSWKLNLLISSLLSLIIGSILGLTQFRIKRLFAYSTISHVGFILLALSINSIESIQAFYFYIIQYSITNLNAFFILITVGYSFTILTKKEKNLNLVNTKDNIYESSYVKNQIDSLSPIQYINQLKGLFFINPILAISLTITIYSFVGIPPLVGFFAKQMILSAALDNGYVFMSLVAILTSVIGGVYYLYIIKQIFFEKSLYNSHDLKPINCTINSYTNHVFLSSSLTSSISILTFLILWFIFIPKEILNMTLILSLC